MAGRIAAGGDRGLPPNSRARPGAHRVGNFYIDVTDSRRRKQRVMLEARRRCLVCDWEEVATEPEETDVVGPGCSRCHAPTERIDIKSRRLEPVALNPHAAALGRLGGARGGLARAAALSPKRRREIARAAARARWDKSTK